MIEKELGKRSTHQKVISLRSANRSAQFDKERLVIGSVVSADYRLDGEGVAPLHAVLELSAAGQLTVFDLASSTGTFLNGKRIASSSVEPGDLLRIGAHAITVQILSSDEARRAAVRSPIARGGGEGDLYLPEGMELGALLLEDERNALPIFDYRPTSRQALEVILAYGDTVLDVEHFVDEKDVVIGPKRRLDFGIPALLEDPKYKLVTRKGAQFTLRLERTRMSGVVQRGGKLLTLSELETPDIELGQNDFAKIEMGEISFYLSFTAAPPRLKRQRLLQRDPFFFRLYGVSLALSVFLLTTIYRSQLPERLEAEQVPERIATILYQPKPLPPPPEPKPEPKQEPKPEPKVEATPEVKPAPPKKIDLDKERPKPKPARTIAPKAQPKPVQKPIVASQPGPGHQAGQNQAKEGMGARAKGKEGTRGEPNKAPSKEKQSAAYRPSPHGGQGRGGGASQVPDEGNVDFLKSYGGKIENILGSAGAQLGRGGEKLKGFGGFSSQGSGGLALSGNGSGGGGTAEGLGGLANKGSGGGRVGTGKGAAGSGSGIIGGSTRVALRTGGAEEVVVMGAIDSAAVEAALLAHKDEFRLCYDREINAERPDLSGSVAALFVIGGSGRATRTAVERSSLGNANVESCVLNVIRRIEFPIPHGGGEVTVTKTFKFNHAGR